MKQYKTEPERYWSGDGGNQYIKRNDYERLTTNNLHLFSTALAKTGEIDSVIEFGANVGYVLKALNLLLPKAALSAVEINPEACRELEARFHKMGGGRVFNDSLIDFSENLTADLVIDKTVLMFIEPKYLPRAYETLFNSSNRYIFVAEYYNPTPTQINWRDSVIYKRDYAGEMLDIFPQLHLLDYGFVYHRDNHFPQDDVNWFLLEKK